MPEQNEKIVHEIKADKVTVHLEDGSSFDLDNFILIGLNKSEMTEDKAKFQKVCSINLPEDVVMALLIETNNFVAGRSALFIQEMQMNAIRDFAKMINESNRKAREN